MSESAALQTSSSPPSHRQDGYRHISFRGVDLQASQALAGQFAALNRSPLQDLSVEDALVIVTSPNGYWIKGPLPSGVAIDVLSRDSISEFLLDDYFVQLHNQRPSVGLSLRVAEGTRLSKPIHWVNAVSGSATQPLRRSLIELENGAEAQVVEEWVSLDSHSSSQSAFHHLTVVKAGENSRMSYSWVQDLAEIQPYVLRTEVQAQADARVSLRGMSLGGSLGQHRIEQVTLGRGALIQMKSAARADARQHMDYWISNRHLTSDTTTSVDFWTVVGGESKAVFNACIHIPQGADRTDSSHKNHNMILTPRSSVVTTPQLEILTDDVKCAHGASVSPVSPEQVFYLQARGIEQSDAEAMIINGFTEPAIAELPVAHLKDRIHARLRKKHGRTGVVGEER